MSYAHCALFLASNAFSGIASCNYGWLGMAFHFTASRAPPMDLRKVKKKWITLAKFASKAFYNHSSVALFALSRCDWSLYYIWTCFVNYWTHFIIKSSCLSRKAKAKTAYFSHRKPETEVSQVTAVKLQLLQSFGCAAARRMSHVSQSFVCRGWLYHVHPCMHTCEWVCVYVHALARARHDTEAAADVSVSVHIPISVFSIRQELLRNKINICGGLKVKREERRQEEDRKSRLYIYIYIYFLAFFTSW